MNTAHEIGGLSLCVFDPQSMSLPQTALQPIKIIQSFVDAFIQSKNNAKRELAVEILETAGFNLLYVEDLTNVSLAKASSKQLYEILPILRLHCPKMHSLNLSNCNLTDEHFHSVADFVFSQLKTLHLDESQVKVLVETPASKIFLKATSSNAFAELKARFPKITIHTQQLAKL